MNSTVPEGLEGSTAQRGGPRWGKFGEVASDALRYWERRRAIYNVILLIVVAVEFFMRWPASRSALSSDTILVCFFLAVLANVAYCAAYAVDLFVQFSGLRSSWGRMRWIVFLVGTAFAATITHFFAPGVFEAGIGR
jgi:ABC-type uncharacterized transport system permease subunit